MKKLILVFAILPFLFTSCVGKKKLADLESQLTELEAHVQLEESIIDYLHTSGFVSPSQITETGWELTPKGEISCEFNEINPVIFGDHLTHIMMGDSNKIIPILSMFIDD